MNRASFCHLEESHATDVSVATKKGLIFIECARNYSKSFLFPFFLSFFLSFFFFLRLHLQHMEAPRLGIKLELQLWSIPQLQQQQIQATSLTYTTAQGNARS